MRHRAFIFTTNNYSEDFLEHLKRLDKKYLIVGKEIAPTTGTPHLQGYIVWKNAKSEEATRKLLPRSRIAIAKGTPQENYNYCSKGGEYFEEGTKPSQGKRNDLHKIKEAISEGMNIRNLIEEEVISNFQGLKMAEALMKYIEPTRNWKPEVIWLYGPTGSGKTRQAMTEAPGAWVSGRNLKWWDGYDGHENVIIDDFRADFCTFHELLRILDRYEYRIENKGGSRQLLCKKILVTSCYHPTDVYVTREDIDQLLRRIDEIRYIE